MITPKNDQRLVLTEEVILDVMRDGNGCRANNWADHIKFARAIEREILARSAPQPVSPDLAAELTKLRELNAKLSETLNETANAIKGDPGPRRRQSWLDLSERATALRKDSEKWQAWVAIQTRVEKDMPKGYAVRLVMSPQNWDVEFTSPDGDRINIVGYQSTIQFIEEAIAVAKDIEIGHAKLKSKP